MKKAFISLVLVSGCFVAKAQWVVVRPPAPRVIVAAPPVCAAVAFPPPRLIITRRPVVVTPLVVVRPHRVVVQPRIFIR